MYTSLFTCLDPAEQEQFKQSKLHVLSISSILHNTVELKRKWLPFIKTFSSKVTAWDYYQTGFWSFLIGYFPIFVKLLGGLRVICGESQATGTRGHILADSKANLDYYGWTPFISFVEMWFLVTEGNVGITWLIFFNYLFRWKITLGHYIHLIAVNLDHLLAIFLRAKFPRRFGIFGRWVG